MKIGGVCVFCIKKMWQVIATLLVIIAVIISILKYTLPHIDTYRNDIQDWVRAEYGAEIYIGNISAGWQGIGPAIVLQNISFLPNESAPLDLVISETRVKLDFWTSIKQFKLSSDYFVLDGVTATINGTSLIQSSDSQSDIPILDALSQLFLGQLKQFSVVNSQINLNTPSGEEQNIAIDELTWTNDKEHHQGVGQFKLGGFAANSLSFILDLNGTKRGDLSGQLFVEATELDISPWLHQFVSQQSDIDKSNINFQSWATINNGLIERAHISLGDNELRWSRDDKNEQLQFGHGQLTWQPTLNGWHISSNDIEFDAGEGQWPKVNLSLKKQHDQVNLYFSQWSVQRATKLLSLLDVSPEVTQSLASYQPQGLVHDLFIEVKDASDWKLTGLFADFGWNNVEDVPGARQLNGHFGMTPDKGWLKVDGSDGYLLTGNLFKSEIYYENLEFNLSFWQDQQQIWQLFVDDLWVHNNDIDLVAEVSVALEPQPNVAVYAEISGNDLSVADKYYPPEYMGQDSIDYLNGAIKAGNLDMAQLLWSGRLSTFPYDHNEGIFLVNTLVSEVDFLFAPGWPILSNIDGELIFRNDSLTIVPQKGYFLDLELADKAVAVIPVLSDALWLDLTIDASVTAASVAKVFKATPLRDIFNPVFEELQVSEPVDAVANIRIPLVEDEKEFNRILNYDGQVSFKNNGLDIVTPKIHLTEVNGLLKFDIDRIWTENFSSQWVGQAIQAQLVGRQYDDAYKVAIKGKGFIEAQPWLTTLNDPMLAYISGDIGVQGSVDLNFPQNGFGFEVKLKADMSNSQLSLPSPYDKALGVDKQLTFNIQGDETSSLVTANYDNRLFFNGILPNEQEAFSQAHLILADRDMGLAGEGFKISVDVEQAQLMPWYRFIDDIVSKEAARPDQPDLFGIPALISGKIGQLNGFDQRLHGVDFELTEGNGSWDLSLNAKETRTTAHIDRDWDGKGITIRTEYLRLASDDSKTDSQGSIHSAKLIASFPPLDFTCIDCQFNGYNLQRIDIETITDNQTLQFTKFNITKGKHQFQSTGQWIGDHGNGISSISGRLSSDDIGQLLNEYELTSTLRDSDAKIDLIANWAGGPHQFNLPSLSGEVKWQMGEGHLSEVSDGGSRILSLFSLDSIVRKLKLDFRDVFSKGFFYNSMKGSMLIDSGIAYTDNTEIDGVPGDLNLQGNVNLVDKRLDYDIVFYPKITSSLPMIIGWMVNPITGIAALALDQMLESTKVIAQVHFNVKGTITDPVVTETERRSRDIQLPKTAVRPQIMPQQDPLQPGKFAEPVPNGRALNQQEPNQTLPNNVLPDNQAPQQPPATEKITPKNQQSEQEQDNERAMQDEIWG